MKNPETTLNISSKNIHSCKDVAKFLQKCGIESNITTNYSVVHCDDMFIIERGCDIKIASINSNDVHHKVWKPLQEKFKLKCAHIKMEEKYEGCILDYKD